MNIIKYRPVGSPSGKVVKVRVCQAKASIYGATGKDRHPTVKEANREMLRRGFLRAGVRHV